MEKLNLTLVNNATGEVILASEVDEDMMDAIKEVTKKYEVRGKEVKYMDIDEVASWLYYYNNELLNRLESLPSWGKACDCEDCEKCETIDDDGETGWYCKNCGGVITKW